MDPAQRVPESEPKFGGVLVVYLSPHSTRGVEESLSLDWRFGCCALPFPFGVKSNQGSLIPKPPMKLILGDPPVERSE